jgi:hypothetical protein
MNWLLFFVLTIVSYTLISWFSAYAGATANGPLDAFKNVLSPLGLGLVLVANILYGVAMYYGFNASKLAIPIAFSIGAIVAWAYSMVYLGKVFELNDLLGVILVLIGIFLLQ